VAVYVDADADAPFVGEADEAVRLRQGYLDGPAIVDVARAAGVDAVHPGYGFLSENAAFAEAVIGAGITWVGPSPAVIEAMGDKLAAKRSAEAAGVPTLPSVDDPAGADQVGYPLLVKAAAGGGGKGMRTVLRAEDLEEAVAAAQREAAAGFGDDRVFLERYVAAARHVEVQILGDRHGALVHLGERECSIQRRHQKIIEESPSPAVDDALRSAMGDAALALAGALGYESAGTVEFLLDDATGAFYFLEVNTRLQVEHPVTEAVTGLDLVREQLRIAAGEPLGYQQADVTFTGHAVEARLYAEDVAAGFLPATGTLVAFEPAPDPAVRWDSGVETGSAVGLQFDPMLAKVIAHGPTRAEAAGRLALALERLHLGGVTTNAAFLAATLRHPAFLAGDTTTDFLDRHHPAAAPELSDPERARLAVAAALWRQGQRRADAPVLAGLPSGWRNARLPAQRTDLALGGDRIEVTYEAQRDGSFLVTVDGDEPRSARVLGWSPTSIDVEVDGHRRPHRITAAGDRLLLQAARGTVELIELPRFSPPEAASAAGGLVAPMPGVAREVRVAVGDHVTAGQVLVVLEAMKMEHHITAPGDGTVTEVHVQADGQVHNGQVLLVLEPQEESAP
ncbi:MAG: biotin carboxylase N-terminal domain-containing protein, partial [Acidimicrobiales bacterium]